MSAKNTISSKTSTIDSSGRRLWIYPSDVSGRYRTYRTWIGSILLFFFLLLPWLRIGGHQAVLLDIWNGRFSIFGLRFWSHDAPILLFVVSGAAVLLAFVTSLWGRLWCGWACPQTIFVDTIFRKIERLIEGNAVTRRQLDQTSWSKEKFLKKFLKWAAYLLISLILSHSFLAYFTGTEPLAAMMQNNPSKNVEIFFAMALITVAILFDFGWLREQFCTLICPYGRFQSVLMDEKSLAVTYDQKRGEPRRGETSRGNPSGDCINCHKCVQVCPTGIDIRNGLQMECIACTACIDACDGVMLKIGKPIGLIRYFSARAAGWKDFTRPVAYFILLGILLSGLSLVLLNRDPIDIALIRKVGAPYDEVVRQGLEKEIINLFKLDLLNQTFDSVEFNLAENQHLKNKGIQLISSALPLKLNPGDSRRIDLFIQFPISQIKEGRGRITIETVARPTSMTQPFTKSKEVPLVGPLH